MLGVAVRRVKIGLQQWKGCAYDLALIPRKAVVGMSKRGAYTYEWPRPGLTVDIFVVAVSARAQQEAQYNKPSVLLIKRKKDPFVGSWALPGGFVDEGERLIDAATRELEEETGVQPAHVSLEQVQTFGDPGRDPRGWTVSVVFTATVDTTDLGVTAADDAEEAEWFPIDDLPQLAFDHKEVSTACLKHLLDKFQRAQGDGVDCAALKEAVARLEDTA